MCSTTRPRCVAPGASVDCYCCCFSSRCNDMRSLPRSVPFTLKVSHYVSTSSLQSCSPTVLQQLDNALILLYCRPCRAGHQPRPVCGSAAQVPAPTSSRAEQWHSQAQDEDSTTQAGSSSQRWSRRRQGKHNTHPHAASPTPPGNCQRKHTKNQHCTAYVPAFMLFFEDEHAAPCSLSPLLHPPQLPWACAPAYSS